MTRFIIASLLCCFMAASANAQSAPESMLTQLRSQEKIAKANYLRATRAATAIMDRIIDPKVTQDRVIFLDLADQILGHQKTVEQVAAELALLTQRTIVHEELCDFAIAWMSRHSTLATLQEVRKKIKAEQERQQKAFSQSRFYVPPSNGIYPAGKCNWQAIPSFRDYEHSWYYSGLIVEPHRLYKPKGWDKPRE